MFNKQERLLAIYLVGHKIADRSHGRNEKVAFVCFDSFNFTVRKKVESGTVTASLDNARASYTKYSRESIVPKSIKHLQYYLVLSCTQVRSSKM